MVLEHLNDYPAEWAAIEVIAPEDRLCNANVAWLDSPSSTDTG